MHDGHGTPAVKTSEHAVNSRDGLSANFDDCRRMIGYETGRLKMFSDGLLDLCGLFAAYAGNFSVVQFDVALCAAAAGDGYAVGGFSDGQGFFHAHGNGGGCQVFG